ncbi:helix-turn-helix domain-containing protein [Aquimarina muelleri]|uniref:AraC family transcriptional regulator n=1 Tax=Aquimarina muelleri TaxID=279356 RepID=A0A918JU02_9FLAO|nr:helix-turn-helix domain-containing protein [Aquimarina muelleri]MCX2761166.1 helix-turn-helix domain-containing protein [Aquimarina muelleri]GGX08780.1 AraC family transcriptional regulator [Aquimarina muelleri]
MNHRIFEPQQNLAEWIKCYWTLESAFENTPLRNTIIPDGTMKLIFHYGDTYKHHPNDKESIILPKYFLIGQLTRPYVVEPLGTTGSFIVRFRPNGFLPFANIDVKKIQNTAVPLDKLFGKDGEEIGEQILNANSTSERIELIETFLLKRLIDKNTIDNIVKSTVETIFKTNGQFSVNKHSKQSNINRRQLTRKFSSTIGLSPKQLSKTIRIQNTLKTLLNKEVASLTNLAYENEYFDQAHFIKDFKEFTGLTPKEFYGDDLKMSMIFDNID